MLRREFGGICVGKWGGLNRRSMMSREEHDLSKL